MDSYTVSRAVALSSLGGTLSFDSKTSRILPSEVKVGINTKMSRVTDMFGIDALKEKGLKETTYKNKVCPGCGATDVKSILEVLPAHTLPKELHSAGACVKCGRAFMTFEGTIGRSGDGDLGKGN